MAQHVLEEVVATIEHGGWLDEDQGKWKCVPCLPLYSVWSCDQEVVFFPFYVGTLTLSSKMEVTGLEYQVQTNLDKPSCAHRLFVSYKEVRSSLVRSHIFSLCLSKWIDYNSNNHSIVMTFIVVPYKFCD